MGNVCASDSFVRLLVKNTNKGGGINISKTQDISALLRQAMQKVPKYNGTAYRALEFKPDKITDFINNHSTIGKTVTFNDFLSSGSTKEAAFFDKASKNVRIIMEVVDAPDISMFADGIRFRGYQPKELLLSTGRKFEITSYKVDNGIHEIRMREIN